MQQFDVDNQPDILYHYTDASALLGILEGHIWASQLHHMNDSEEQRHIFKLANEILQEKYGTEERIPRHLSYILEQTSGNMKFAFSLSEEPDLLSQWRGYCPNGGYSIGFDITELNNQLRQHDLELQQCVYSDSEKRRTVEKILASHNLMDESANASGPQASSVIHSVASELFALDSAFKHQSFSEEKEWRFVGSFNQSKLDWRTKNGIPMPFSRWNYDAAPCVREIIVGPKLNSSLAKATVEFLTRSDRPEIKLSQCTLAS